MKRDSLHDGRRDGLSPLQSLDLGQVTTFADLLRAMSQTAFSGRQLGEAFEIVLEMARNHDCRVVLTVSGAMTVAKQGRMICDMIDHHLVDAVVATGALIAHGLTESIGLTHYRHDPSIADVTLFQRGYNRVHDTLEMESNLNDVETLVRGVLNDETPPDGVWSSARICRALGRRLSELGQGPGVLRSAYEQDVPVFIPAMTDSELGLDFATWAMSRALAGRRPPPGLQDPQDVFQAVPNFNPFVDLQQYARFAGTAALPGYLHDRRWGAAQLGSAGGSLLRHRQSSLGARTSRAALSLRRADLSRAGALGGPVRMHVCRRSQLGQVPADQ